MKTRHDALMRVSAMESMTWRFNADVAMSISTPSSVATLVLPGTMPLVKMRKSALSRGKSAAIRAASPISDKSALTNVTLRPGSRKVRPTIVTVAPAALAALAKPRPMPFVPPIMITFLPSSFTADAGTLLMTGVDVLIPNIFFFAADCLMFVMKK